MGYLSYWNNLHLYSILEKNCLFSGIVLLGLFLPIIATAGAPQNTAEDCGESAIRYQDDPSLPRAERLEKMHQAFIDSVNRFEACELSDPTSASENAGAGGGGDAGIDGVSGNAATASQEMRGTEATAETFPETTAESFSDENVLEKPPGINNTNASANNGAIPEDIPATNNDDAVAAQIRLAAENETDPEIREKLWNEYRKYKGMEIVE